MPSQYILFILSPPFTYDYFCILNTCTYDNTSTIKFTVICNQLQIVILFILHEFTLSAWDRKEDFHPPVDYNILELLFDKKVKKRMQFSKLSIFMRNIP